MDCNENGSALHAGVFDVAMATAAGLIMKPIVASRAVDTTVYGHFTKAKLCYALLLRLRCMVAAASLVFPAQRTRSTVFDALALQRGLSCPNLA